MHCTPRHVRTTSSSQLTSPAAVVSLSASVAGKPSNRDDTLISLWVSNDVCRLDLSRYGCNQIHCHDAVVCLTLCCATGSRRLAQLTVHCSSRFLHKLPSRVMRDCARRSLARTHRRACESATRNALHATREGSRRHYATTPYTPSTTVHAISRAPTLGR